MLLVTCCQSSLVLACLQVLVTPVGRLKVCGLGVSEALAGEVVPTGAEELLQLQRDDVVVSQCITRSRYWTHACMCLHDSQTSCM